MTILFGKLREHKLDLERLKKEENEENNKKMI